MQFYAFQCAVMEVYRSVALNSLKLCLVYLL